MVQYSTLINIARLQVAWCCSQARRGSEQISGFILFQEHCFIAFSGVHS